MCAAGVFDTGHAVLEHGHNPRPPILTVKNGRQTAQRQLNISKIVPQVCHDTGHAVLEYCQNPEPQNVHDRLLLWWLEHDQVKGVSTLKSSQAVSHTSTNQALCRLTLEI